MRTQTTDGGWGWVICFCCFVIHVLLGGPFYTFGIMFVEYLEYFGKSKAETAWIASIFLGSSDFAAPVYSMIINRFGYRTSCIAGILLFSGGLIISSFANDLHFLYFSYGIVMGLGFGMVTMAALVTINQFFLKRRSFATGVALSGMTFGAILFGPATDLFIDKYTWRGALLLQGGLGLNCLACALLFRKPDTKMKVHQEMLDLCISQNIDDMNNLNTEDTDEPKENIINVTKFPETEIISTVRFVEREKRITVEQLSDFDEENEDITSSCVENKTEDNANQFDDKETDPGADKEYACDCIRYLDLSIMRDRSFQIIMLSAILLCLGLFVLISYVVDTARTIGISKHKSAWLISSFGISNTVSRILIGLLGNHRKVNRRYLFAAVLIIHGIGTAMIPLFKSYAVLMLLATISGGCTGGIITLLYVLMADAVGPQKFSDAMGISSFLSAIASSIGLPIAGWLNDKTHTYLATYLFGGCTLVASGLVMLIPIKQR